MRGRRFVIVIVDGTGDDGHDHVINARTFMATVLLLCKTSAHTTLNQNQQVFSSHNYCGDNTEKEVRRRKRTVHYTLKPCCICNTLEIQIDVHVKNATNHTSTVQFMKNNGFRSTDKSLLQYVR